LCAWAVRVSNEAALAVTHAAPLKEVEGKTIAKRGRIPGITENPRLKQLI
jgi:hypothetical protein